MSILIARKLKAARIDAHLSQNEVAIKMGLSERKIRSIENNEHSITIDDLLEFAKLYNVDPRELFMESYEKISDEQALCNRYASFLELLDQLSDKDREDIIWIVKQRVEGKI